MTENKDNCTFKTFITVIVTCIISVVLTIFFMMHVCKYRKETNTKTDGGYVSQSFISTELPVSSDDAKKIDDLMKSSVIECFTDDEQTCNINANLIIPFEETVKLFSQEENLNEMARKLLKFPEEFEPDSSVIFNDSPNTVFIFEFDEGGNFHTNFKNPYYVKKTINYNNMILHNNPDHNTSFIIVRITYPTDINKDYLVDTVFPILEYIKKYHLLFISVLLGSGYVLIKITKTKIQNLVLIDKETMTTCTDKAKEKSLDLKTLYKSSESLTKRGTILKYDPIPYEEIERSTPLSSLIVQNGTLKFTGGNINNDLYISTIPIEQMQKVMNEFRLSSILSFHNCDTLINYYPRISINDIEYTVKYRINNSSIFNDIFDDIDNGKNFTLSDYDFSKYPKYKTPYYDGERGKRTIFKKFVIDSFKYIISNSDELYHDRICFFNSLFGAFIQLYENWFSMHSYSHEDDIFYPAVCHATDDFYDDLHIGEMIEILGPFIIPEFVDRIQHSSRIMCSEDFKTKGINDKLKMNEDKEWVIPSVNEFNKLTKKFISTVKDYNV